jgi:hypothetical protein
MHDSYGDVLSSKSDRTRYILLLVKDGNEVREILMLKDKRKWWSIGLMVILLTSLLIPPHATTFSAELDELVYDDRLNEQYANYSWADVNLTSTEQAYKGKTSIRVEPDFEKAMYLYRQWVVETSKYDTFEMWVHGGASGSQEVKLVFQAGGVPQTTWNLHELLDNGIQAGEWVKVSIPADKLAPQTGLVDTIILADTSGTDQGAIFVDEMKFLAGKSNEEPDPTTEPTNPIPVEQPAPSTEPRLPIKKIDGLAIYQDKLLDSFQDYGWAQHSLEEVNVVHTGEKSISMEPDNGGAIYLYSNHPILAKEYKSFEMSLHGGTKGGQKLKLVFQSGGQPVKEFRVEELLGGPLLANEWSSLHLNLEEAGLGESIIDTIIISDATNTDQPVLYLDDIALVKKEYIPPAIVEIRMDIHQMLLTKEEEQQLQLEAFYVNGTTADITETADWVSEHPEVVSVDKGKLTGLSNGISKITAKIGEYTASAYIQVTDIEAISVYQEGVEPGFSNWSWHEKEMESQEVAHSGNQAIKFFPSGWDGVWIEGHQERRAGEYYGVEFWIHGGETGGQNLLIHLYEGYSNAGNVDLNNYLPNGKLAANTWHKVRINLADFGIADTAFTGIVFQAATSENQPAVFIDDIVFFKNTTPGQLPQPELATVKVEINTAQERRAVSPEIYGINYHDTRPIESDLPFPVERWGGNNTTRYNWELDVANRASDWFFMNFPYENGDSNEADKMIDRVTDQGGKVLLTLPTIGWTPKDREVSWGYSVDKYGEQQQTVGGSYPDAGNGTLLDGTLITGNNPEDTSKKIGPDFVTNWIDHLQKKGDKVNYYALDNEPEIWHVTHRDVHPYAPTYDELWNMTETYGAAIKAKDPDSQVFGPTTWGWCGYFFSSADNCVDGPDRQNHGGTPFLEWYLQKLNQYKKDRGVSLVDYLDIHYYPQENGIPSENESTYVAKRRFQSLKTLYDPTFVDQSWIQEPIRLIPRMKEMIETHNPGMKLAITEYNFGNSNGITSGLAQAEALAIFGREGVDLATRFGALDPNTPMEDAFKLYLNYDGKGSKIEGTSLKTSSSNVDAVGAYTIEGRNGELYVLLFNKDVVARSADMSVTVPENEDMDMEAYRFTSEERLHTIDFPSTNSENRLQITLPARSATLLVIR